MIRSPGWMLSHTESRDFSPFFKGMPVLFLLIFFMNAVIVIEQVFGSIISEHLQVIPVYHIHALCSFGNGDAALAGADEGAPRSAPRRSSENLFP